ncbi:MAG: CBS domain-containing protein [Gammaproteobacteria bacterium]|nr:CBS domain-containing protein [Gammaproteobacteria bacterium]
MQVVNEILADKGKRVYSVSPTSSAHAALSMMVDKGIGSVLVIEGDQILGILSERDYLRKVALGRDASPDATVEQIMTSQVLCVRPDQPIDECMALMTDKRVRHLPVVQDGRVVGVVSIGDLVKAVISEQKFIIKQLENYIAG